VIRLFYFGYPEFSKIKDQRRQGMSKGIKYAIIGILLIGLLGCSVSTPEIRGLVLDADSKQPVAEAWINATLGLTIQTIGGRSDIVLRVDPSHARTDQNGKFTLPSKSFNVPPFPLAWDTEPYEFLLRADTIDDRTGGLTYVGGFLKKSAGKGDGDLKRFLRQDLAEVTIFLKPIENFDEEYISSLQELYHYCFWGRFLVEVPPVEGGCDQWELNYAIAKDEGFLKRLGEPKSGKQRNYYAATMKRLGYLLKKKGEYDRALEIFIALREFDKRINMNLWLKEYEVQINELQGLTHGNR
jgi:hypothetical protein